MLEVSLRRQLDRFELELDFETTARAAGVFGPSGSGKTSLLRAIAGLDRRARGRIVCDGEVWLDSTAGIAIPPERRGVGYVPQEGLLFPHLDVRRNLLSGSARARRRGADVEATLEAVCDLLEIGPLLGRRVATLSGGERQRVALGRAICSGPRLLVLDEPLASLDQTLRRKILPYLRRVRRELDLPMLLVSHDAAEVQAVCEEVLALENGRLLARGPVRRVLADPRVFPLTREEGYVNVVPGRLSENRGLAGSSAGVSVVSLSAVREGLRLHTPPIEGEVGDEVLLGIPAREIILAIAEPLGLSARNVLPAEIVALERSGEMWVVSLELAPDAPRWVSVVTPEARTQLGLEPGRGVFLILKTAGCLPFDGQAARESAG